MYFRKIIFVYKKKQPPLRKTSDSGVDDMKIKLKIKVCVRLSFCLFYKYVTNRVKKAVLLYFICWLGLGRRRARKGKGDEKTAKRQEEEEEEERRQRGRWSDRA